VPKYRIDEGKVKKIIRERKGEAIRRDIGRKAKAIVFKLGKRRGWATTFERDPLKIIKSLIAPSSITVEYRGVEVYQESLSLIIRFRPDIEGWMELLDEIYEKEVAPFEEELSMEDRERLEELERDWGIKPEEVLVEVKEAGRGG